MTEKSESKTYEGGVPGRTSPVTAEKGDHDGFAGAYEFTPSGAIDEETAASFGEMCRANGLTREQAHAQYEWMRERAEQYGETAANVRADWVASLRADKEFGRERFERTVSEACRVLDRFDTDGSVRALLDASGYGDNPHIVRLCARVGQALAEDAGIGRGARGQQHIPLANRLYPDM